ncbi:MAG: xanthine dehydrogenase family protein molybdopterin-binding subunit [Firmicutes bacterium]|nr:xanthine dehydrogenase family protein molybdopterin-binding subunit [Bacillota bacterium]
MSGTTVTTQQTARTQWSGQSIPRKEDERLVKGQGRFADDIRRHNEAYVYLLRSPYGHARIRRVDVRAAQEAPGVIMTLTGDEVREIQKPFMEIAPPPGGYIEDYCLAVDKVRFMGEPVVAILAETAEQARDAADLVDIEYEPLDAVVTGEDALKDTAPLLHGKVGSNVVWHGLYDWGSVEEAKRQADKIVKIDRLHFHRFTSTPIECNAAVVEYYPGSGEYTFWCNNTMPQFAAMFMGPALGIPTDRLHFVTQDIGGSFGNKITTYVYLTICAILAKKSGRPVHWTEYRTDHILGGSHGNERTFLDIEVPVLNDGTILGLSARAIDDCGAYPRYEPLGSVIWSQVVPGVYRFRNVRIDYTQVVTNKCPVGPNRGYSRLQHMWMLERVIDIVAHELNLDPVEIRKKNYIKPDEMPYETPNGCVYDSGDYPRCLDMALKLINYDYWRQRQAEVRGTGKLIGIGIGSTLDSGTNNFGQARIINPELPFSGNGEVANVKLDLYGEVVVTIGTTPQGQGHETTAAQVVSDILGVSPDRVRVLIGHDNARNVYTGFSGTYASQFAVTGLGAVQGAAQKLKREIQQLAAGMMGSDPEEIELVDGTARVVGRPDTAIPFIGLANVVFANNATMPEGLDVSLNCTYTYRPPFKVPDVERKFGNLTLTYATQIHACVVEVDEATGETKILDYAAVDDSGRLIHPQIVEGQVHGAAGLGIGAALYETLEYDAEGQMLTPNFYAYKAVTALDVPMIKTAAIESPSPFSPNGAKGMGEGGGAPLHAICSALQDVMRQTSRAIVHDSFNPSERVYRLLRQQPSARRGVEVISNRS